MTNLNPRLLLLALMTATLPAQAGFLTANSIVISCVAIDSPRPTLPVLRYESFVTADRGQPIATTRKVTATNYDLIDLHPVPFVVDDAQILQGTYEYLDFLSKGGDPVAYPTLSFEFDTNPGNKISLQADTTKFHKDYEYVSSGTTHLANYSFDATVDIYFVQDQVPQSYPGGQTIRGPVHCTAEVSYAGYLTGLTL